ncbi:hypothetical protein NIES2119_08020 [[Phormidium ambiguum] IAM M-71]|uniref:Uncharacterized protein n=2 Tax=[Phormidium ambiguum] IAM M-71 TaxID=454136 RepID=A0A1U7IP32_9CYAN|nr:hypothetical protein NIES2119_08020 [Phormidium ambiguum IAM M-71]
MSSPMENINADYEDEFCRTCGCPLYIPNPPQAGAWYCDNPNCPDCDESVFEREELEEWYREQDLRMFYEED